MNIKTDDSQSGPHKTKPFKSVLGNYFFTGYHQDTVKDPDKKREWPNLWKLEDQLKIQTNH